MDLSNMWSCRLLISDVVTWDDSSNLQNQKVRKLEARGGGIAHLKRDLARELDEDRHFEVVFINWRYACVTTFLHILYCFDAPRDMLTFLWI